LGECWKFFWFFFFIYSRLFFFIFIFFSFSFIYLRFFSFLGYNPQAAILWLQFLDYDSRSMIQREMIRVSLNSFLVFLFRFFLFFYYFDFSFHCLFLLYFRLIVRIWWHRFGTMNSIDKFKLLIFFLFICLFFLFLF
jgi:hypothetical protein